jgi:hypothetical protein
MSSANRQGNFPPAPITPFSETATTHVTRIFPGFAKVERQIFREYFALTLGLAYYQREVFHFTFAA